MMNVKQTTIKQVVKIICIDPIQFAKSFQEVVIRGGRYNETTYVYLSSAPYIAEFTVDIDENDLSAEWTDNGPWIQAVPLNKARFIYTKQQLEEMEWETFKSVLKDPHGIGGRSREQMTREYLKVTEQI